MDSEFGVIIVNRDRPQPLQACLTSLAAQVMTPRWVAIADLGSSPANAQALHDIAERFAISYVRIDYFARWNQALAFNTAFRHMPAVRHVIQLDADFILHPYLLAFTHRALAFVEALCCVRSYLDVREVPPNYDGSMEAFSQLLSKSHAADKRSRGGYVVLPAEWLSVNGCFDEKYEGWGFEDGDLWWRLQQQLTTYEETSGSLALHQSHPRDPGNSEYESNPNWTRYQRRISGVPLGVNPGGFGGAPVSYKSVRYGICSLPAREQSLPQVPYVRARSRTGDRLRPATETRLDPNEMAVSECQDTFGFEPGRERSRIAVLLLLGSAAPYAIRQTLDYLAAQSTRPDEVILVGKHAPVESASLCSAYEHCFTCCEYWPQNDPENPAVTTLRNRLGSGDQSTKYLLVLTAGLLLHPRFLHFIYALEEREECFSYGAVHTLPPLACELSLLDNVPWNAWAAIAHREARELGWWHILPRSWATGFYSEGLSVEELTNGNAVGRAQQLFPGRLRRLPEGLALCLCSPRKVDLPDVYDD